MLRIGRSLCDRSGGRSVRLAESPYQGVDVTRLVWVRTVGRIHDLARPFDPCFESSSVQCRPFFDCLVKDAVLVGRRIKDRLNVLCPPLGFHGRFVRTLAPVREGIGLAEWASRSAIERDGIDEVGHDGVVDAVADEQHRIFPEQFDHETGRPAILEIGTTEVGAGED